MLKKYILMFLLLILVVASLGCSSSVSFNTNYNMPEEHPPQPLANEKRFNSDETSFYTPEGWHVEVKEGGYFDAVMSVKKTEDLRNLPTLQFNWQGKEVKVSSFTFIGCKDDQGYPCNWLGSQSNSAYDITVSKNGLSQDGKMISFSSVSGKTGVEEGVLVYSSGKEEEVGVIVSGNI